MKSAFKEGPQRSGKKGVIKEQILKYGPHDQLMSYPATAMAAFRTFQAAAPAFCK